MLACLVATANCLLGNLFGPKSYGGLCVMGEDSIMDQKKHGTSDTPVQKGLRWNCDERTADNICSARDNSHPLSLSTHITSFFHTADFNRHYAERAGYWERSTTFLKEESMSSGEITFYDSNTGKPLFYAPKGRSWENFVRESKVHGWPSFRDEEVNWDLVRVLGNGECVSTAGTHLGHNLPDGSGNRYCINLVSVAGNPVD